MLRYVVVMFMLSGCSIMPQVERSSLHEMRVIVCGEENCVEPTAVYDSDTSFVHIPVGWDEWMDYRQ